MSNRVLHSLETLLGPIFLYEREFVCEVYKNQAISILYSIPLNRGILMHRLSREMCNVYVRFVICIVSVFLFHRLY